MSAAYPSPELNAVSGVAPSPPFAVTFFSHHTATSKAEEPYTLASLQSRILTVTAGEKAKLPWLKLARFGNQKTDKGSLRHDGNMLAISGIEADYDGGRMGFDAAAEILTKAGVSALIYTSPSHTDDSPRFRVLCTLSTEYPPERRDQFLGRLNGLFRGIFAGESWTRSQSYYYGSVRHNPSHRAEIIEGFPIDECDELDAISMGKSGTTAGAVNGSQRQTARFDEPAVLEQLVSGDSYHVSAMRLLGHWARDGVAYMEARQRLRDAMTAVFPADRDARWQARWDDLDRCLDDVYVKDARKKDEPGGKPTARSASREKDAPKPKLSFCDPTSLHGKPIPERRWIVPGWLPAAAVTLNYAAGGEGKTLLAQQLMTSCATGTPWLGLQVQQTRAIGLFCEDDLDELHRRQEAICRAYGIDFINLANMRWTAPVGDDNTLVRFDHDGSPMFTQRFEDLAEQAKAFEPGLIVLDVAADLFGGNENIRQQVSTFLKFGLGSLARDTGAAVLLNAHPSRAGISSGDLDGGSTGWNGGARSRWSVLTPGGEDGEPRDETARILTKRKANYSTRGDEIRLRFRDGVLMREGDLGNGVVASIERRNCQETFLELLDAVAAVGLHVSASVNGNYAPRLFSQRPDRKGFGKREFEVAMHALFAAERISVAAYGKPSDKTFHIINSLHQDDGEGGRECPVSH